MVSQAFVDPGACGHTVLREHEERPLRCISGFGASEGPYLGMPQRVIIKIW
jgi:hypothetical protein